MNAHDLKSLLYDYLAILRYPGGAERIGFALEQHIARLDLLATCNVGPVSISDLPRYSESTPRNIEEPSDVIPPFAKVEKFPCKHCTS
jgi:hypothetical protein